MTPAIAREELVRLLCDHGLVPARGQPYPVAERGRSPDPAPSFPIDRAALLLAVDVYPGLDPACSERRLDGHAARVAGALSPRAEPLDRIAALRRVLYEEEGFHGNREHYYDVRNSYLNEVLDRKLGIPISLATVLLGVSRRLGWPLRGVNFPGHFLVSYAGSEEPLALDPFDGLILGAEELEQRWRFATGYESPDFPVLLVPASWYAMLVRMLNNILNIHLHEGDLDGAALAVEKMRLIQPEEPQHERNLGILLLRTGQIGRGRRCIERYLERAPHAPDADVLRAHLETHHDPSQRDERE